ncbi:RloB-like protein [Ruminiclostridium sufflavum DSM 19573]|uniref:RloB-like protein n=1 Tax=Ruminiclostridium sufflavum DSM 19573 TaxID=1121337 RepID=A0A318XJ93_9FIRM|nr:RloB family protein [Ruminiclostridium sufflavum]PYG84919.1 RloB-like protein [Ruminiclostridium sufflavum DSM 19573]
MAKLKQTKKYYFSVEGETEQWYFKWLQSLINETPESVFKVSFDCPVQKNPLKRAKSIVVTGKTDIYHISDYESDEEIHVRQFKETMDNMKQAKDLGKQINYKFGYSNLTFDLWIVLHKSNCNGSLAHRRLYLSHINSAYGENFENMDEYKHENNFKRMLSQLTLQNVKDAVNRAKQIMKRNAENGYVLQEYKGYRYYKENPSLAVWEVIERVLVECELV